VKNYRPQAGSVPEQVINFLRNHGPTRSNHLASALSKRGADLYAFLKSALNHKAILAAGAGGRVRVFYLPGQDPSAALAEAVGIPLASPSSTTEETTPMASRKKSTTDPEPSAEAPRADSMTITLWDDGDVFLGGEYLVFTTGPDDEINGLRLSRCQAAQLVRFLARPAVEL